VRRNTRARVLLLGAVFIVAANAVVAVDHKVTAKRQTVAKDANIDFNDEEASVAESITALGFNIVIRSKMFTPPTGKSFLKFAGTATYVDVKDNPDELPVVRVHDTTSAIQVQSTFVGATAGNFPLSAEGNLGGGGGGGGSGGEGVHWSAKVGNTATSGLILTDINSTRSVIDFDDDDPPPPSALNCGFAQDKKGDVNFGLFATSGSYSWKITNTDTQVVFDSGTLTASETPEDHYRDTCNDVPVGEYTLEVTDSDPETLKREIPFVVTALVRIVAAPKILAADAKADYPVYFEIVNLTHAEITSVKFDAEVNDSTTVTSTSQGSARLKAGDAVRGNGGAGANGSTNSYTVFVDQDDIKDLSLTSSGYHRSSTGKIKVTVTFTDPDDDDREYTSSSEWVEVGGILDQYIQCCHLGENYSNSEGNDPIALNISPVSNCNRIAVPYTRQLRNLQGACYGWATHKADSIASEDWTLHWSQKKNVEFWNMAIYRWRNAGWLQPSDFNMTTRIDTGCIPFSDPKEQWMELMASEERGTVFVWLWGIREVTDISSETRTVIDVRKKFTTTASAHLFPGAQVELGVGDIGEAESWSWGASVKNSIGIISGVLAIASGPPGWAAAAAYVTVVMTTGDEVSNILGGLKEAGGGDEGGKVTAFGAIAVNKSNGDPDPAERWGDGGSGLGGPNADEFTQTAPGSKTKNGSVKYATGGAQALQTWKLNYSFTTAAWAVEGYILNEQARAWIKWNYGDVETQPDADGCLVTSDVSSGTADGQWVGEPAE